VQAFLEGGSAPSGPDEDGPTIMSMTTPVPGKDGGICETPNR
jgi:hypothetical protein